MHAFGALLADVARTAVNDVDLMALCPSIATPMAAPLLNWFLQPSYLYRRSYVQHAFGDRARYLTTLTQQLLTLQRWEKLQSKLIAHAVLPRLLLPSTLARLLA